MVKIIKFFAYVLFFALALAIFTPKSSVYFLLEQKIKEFNVVISNETLVENALSLSVQNLNISVKGIEAAVVAKSDITLLIFYNSVKFHDVNISSLADSFLPSKVQSVEVHYTIFNPLVLSGDGVGAFGEAKFEFDILDKNLSVILKPSKIMLRNYRNSLAKFKKVENGEYRYDKTF